NCSASRRTSLFSITWVRWIRLRILIIAAITSSDARAGPRSALHRQIVKIDQVGAADHNLVLLRNALELGSQDALGIRPGAVEMGIVGTPHQVFSPDDAAVENGGLVAHEGEAHMFVEDLARFAPRGHRGNAPR